MYSDSSNKSRLLFVIILVNFLILAGWIIWQNGSRKAYGGLPEPVQTPAQGETHICRDGMDIHVRYLYEYEVDAMVLHTKNYLPTGFDGKLSPRDLALGWGTVAQFNEVIDFHWSQSNRWYSWRVDSYEELSPVGREAEVNHQSSNNHIIPADNTVRSVISRMRRGDHIRLKGYLVDISASDSGGRTYTWVSSTSRLDTGAHACEVIYVTDAEIVK